MTENENANPPTLEGERQIAEARKKLSSDLKSALIDHLSLQLNVNEIADDTPLFGTGLELDSLDSLELAIVIEAKFGVTVKDDDMQAFRSINTVLDFIEQNRGN